MSSVHPRTQRRDFPRISGAAAAAAARVRAMHALRHLLTPGSPVYALLKVAAIVTVVAVQVAIARRKG